MLQTVQIYISDYFCINYAINYRISSILIFNNMMKSKYEAAFLVSILLLLLPVYGKCSGGFEEIAPGIYFRAGLQEEFSRSNRGHIANIGFIVGSERVAVIDTGSSLQEGQMLRRAIRKITDLPIAFVILTHMHPDHALGAAAFIQDRPRFIGHSQLGDALVRRQSVYLNNMQRILGSIAEDTRVVLPDQAVSVDHVMRLDLGGRWLQLTAYPTAHTNNDLTIYDSKSGTFWLSDLLFIERIPVVDGSLLGWLKINERLSGMDCFNTSPYPDWQKKNRSEWLPQGCLKIVRVVPGHGPVVSDWQGALSRQQHYLNRIADDIRKIIENDGTMTQAVEQAGIDENPNWLLFNEYHGRNVTAAFAELEWE